MSLLYCHEKTGRGGTSAGIFDTEVQRVWEIKHSSKSDSIFSSIASLQLQSVSSNQFQSLPLYLQFHPEVPFASARRMQITEDGGSGVLYLVTVTYSSKPLNVAERDKFETPNPINRKPRRFLEALEYEKYVNVDRDGEGIANSAGSPFLDPAYIPSNDYILHVRQNFSSWPAWVFNYNNKVNENELTVKPSSIAATQTIAAEKALFKFRGTSEPQEENGVTFVEITYDLHVRSDDNGWKHTPVDKGLFELSGGDRVRITVDGEPAVEDQFLNGSGVALTGTIDPADIVTREFNVIPKVDMTELSVLAT